MCFFFCFVLNTRHTTVKKKTERKRALSMKCTSESSIGSSNSSSQHACAQINTNYDLRTYNVFGKWSTRFDSDYYYFFLYSRIRNRTLAIIIAFNEYVSFYPAFSFTLCVCVCMAFMCCVCDVMFCGVDIYVYDTRTKANACWFTFMVAIIHIYRAADYSIYVCVYFIYVDIFFSSLFILFLCVCVLCGEVACIESHFAARQASISLKWLHYHNIKYGSSTKIHISTHSHTHSHTHLLTHLTFTHFHIRKHF